MKNTVSIINQFIGANNQSQFVIPTYQRNYVWDNKQVVQLLKDIESQFINENKNNIMHYIGTIVTIETKKKGFFSEKTIIDGQQRLTTIFLILYAIKYICNESDNPDLKNTAEIITSSYLENKIYNTEELDEKYKFRLKPLVSDDDVFEKIANGKIGEYKDEYKDSKVYKAFVTIKKTVSKWLETYTVSQIINAMDKLRFMWLELDQESNPQQVFESINSTGLPLTQADLIRNYILMNKPNDIQTSYYNEYWVPIESEYVKTDKLAEFFRFYISSKVGFTISQKEVYDEFKKIYNDLLADESEIDALKEIKNFAKYYKFITREYVDKSKDEDCSIEYALRDYRNIESNMPHIVLLGAFNLFYNDLIDQQDMVNTINLLTSYIIRRNLCGLDTKSISGTFGSVLDKTLKEFNRKKESFYNSLVRVLVFSTKQLSQYMPTDNNVNDEFLNSNLFSRGLLRFALEKIENFNNRVPLPYNELSIEHVMPQTSTDYWKKQIKNVSDYDQIVNHIGNLTLVSVKDNSTMKNHDFESKKESLAKTKHIKLNEEILQSKIWNEEKINNRSKELASVFNEIFKYPDLSAFDEEINSFDLLNDNAALFSSLSPIKLSINSHDIEVSSWTDVFKYVMKDIYDLNIEVFKEKIGTLFDKFNYDNNPISESKDDLRRPYEITNGLYVELNNNTSSKIKLIRRLAEEFNYKVNVIIYVDNKIEIDNVEESE